jgi:hypothetical protein
VHISTVLFAAGWVFRLPDTVYNDSSAHKLPPSNPGGGLPFGASTDFYLTVVPSTSPIKQLEWQS